MHAKCLNSLVDLKADGHSHSELLQNEEKAFKCHEKSNNLMPQYLNDFVKGN